MDMWTWTRGGLRDPNGVEVATVRAGVIHVGADQILPEISRENMHLSIQASTSRGEVLYLTQDGFSINRLLADCAGRHYVLARTRRFRRERMLYDAAGTPFARTRPRGDWLEIHDHPADTTVPDLDFVFLTWAVMEADNSGRVRI